MYIILVYDIKQEEEYAKVQRHVFKICKRYLTHIQNSVFEGELTVAQLEKLKLELRQYLRPMLDSCIVFKSRTSRWLSKEFVTAPMIENEQFI